MIELEQEPAATSTADTGKGMWHLCSVHDMGDPPCGPGQGCRSYCGIVAQDGATFDEGATTDCVVCASMYEAGL